jgi:hypothetical protein
MEDTTVEIKQITIGGVVNTHYSHVDTNAEILEIGIELGELKRFLMMVDLPIDDDFNLPFLNKCLTDRLLGHLDRCLELWIKYNQITAPVTWYQCDWKISTGRKAHK